MSLPAFLFLVRTAENRTLCRARALGKRVSVFSPRARTPVGGRSRRGFAKQIRGFSAQSLDPIWMRCYRISAGHAPHQRNPPYRGESNSVQGAGVKKTPWQRRPGHTFPMVAEAESASRNPRSDWDVVSGWRLKRKAHPGISPQTGIHFPLHLPPQKPMRSPSQNWVEESQNAIAGGQYDCRR